MSAYLSIMIFLSFLLCFFLFLFGGIRELIFYVLHSKYTTNNEHQIHQTLSSIGCFLMDMEAALGTDFYIQTPSRALMMEPGSVSLSKTTLP